MNKERHEDEDRYELWHLLAARLCSSSSASRHQMSLQCHLIQLHSEIRQTHIIQSLYCRYIYISFFFLYNEIFFPSHKMTKKKRKEKAHNYSQSTEPIEPMIVTYCESQIKYIP